jgi:GT2 family glycosyltransferase
MDVTIVIPVLNQLRFTEQCLDTLRAAGVPESRIVVVDNGSTDGTAAYLAARPGIKVIHNDANLGCGGAWNQGIRALPATWTVLLNNDVLIPQGWLDGLVSFAEEFHADVVSPSMCEGESDYDVAAIARESMEVLGRVRRFGAVSGVCFMVHRRVFDKVGLFDDDPRLGGYEDDEFFRRVREAGFRLALTGRSFLHHFGSITQLAIKAERHQAPTASLGDRAYYRQKYQLTWFKRKRWRLERKVRTALYRTIEKARFGRTLLSRRIHGVVTWR